VLKKPPNKFGNQESSPISVSKRARLPTPVNPALRVASIYDFRFSHFDTIPERDKHTDRETGIYKKLLSIRGSFKKFVD